MTTTIERVRAEFLEMPCLRVTREQVQRLCGVERTTCQGILDALVDLNFLRVNADRTYMRATEGRHPHPAATR